MSDQVVRDNAIRVVVADDQDMVRAGFRLLLEQPADIEVVADAGDGRAAVGLAERVRPDVLLMDIRMPRLDGLAATRRITQAQPDCRVIVLTTFDIDDYVYEALRAGASGFLLKSAPAETLIQAIRTVAAGDALLDPAVTRRVIEQFGRLPAPVAETPAELAWLTGREREVLVQLARGFSNAEIASALYVSDATIKTHVARILAKLGLRDRVQAVVYAYEHGLAGRG
ncbi:MAG TPA: response regulator transcription factor [Flexivirga sp.]|uniref:response regulator transcription factor n=1 Tax=Flexivirga sp. TaxID=1962927 RepID=UPI002BF11303|nr:response regulator transcription factor [Flexivirga sp.]HWC24283.1 response regulator transcription factor [Flexivirga sp.]